MDGLQLRDEAVRERVRQAQDFLDPSKSYHVLSGNPLTARR